jgi:DNA-binding beta-propeller fold protein YncE
MKKEHSKIILPPHIIISIIALNFLFFLPLKSQDSPFVIYPAPPAPTKIQYLTSYSTSADFKKKQSAFNKFVFGPEEQTPIVKPYGISVQGTKVYICDTGIKGLIISDLAENTFDYFIPGGKGQLQFPINCDVDSDGNIYVADGNRKQVVIFDAELSYKDAITLKEDVKPTDVSVEGSKIWITAVNDHKIYVYRKSDYSFIASFPEGQEKSEGYLYQPANLSVDDNLIYISDIGACKVHIYDDQMKHLISFGDVGKGFGNFTRPKGICSDKEGNIYVVDAAFENIQVFDPTGALLLYFGGTYNGPGGMWLPADVTIDYGNLELFSEFVDPDFKLNYLIFVTNQYGPDKVSVYGFVDPL